MKSPFPHGLIICPFHPQEAQELFLHEFKNRSFSLTIQKTSSLRIATNSQILQRLGRASDPCLAELLLRTFHKVARKRLPGIAYKDAKRTVSVLSPKSHSFLILSRGAVQYVAPIELLHTLNICDAPTTVVGAVGEGADSEEKHNNHDHHHDNKYVIVCIHNRSSPMLQALTYFILTITQ